MLVSLHLLRKHTGLRDIPMNSFTIHPYCLIIRNTLLMISLYETIQIQRLLTAWGSGMDILSFTVFPGDSGKLNASHFAIHIRMKAGGYLPYTEIFQSFLKSENS